MNILLNLFILKFIDFILGYSSISFTHGYYGHVFVGNSRYEVCYNRYNNRVGEALCGWYGYSYKTYLRYWTSSKNTRHTWKLQYIYHILVMKNIYVHILIQ